MRHTRTFLLLLLALTACGGINVVLKSPVESKCSSAHLKGCPELTEGVLLYVQGEEQKGKDQLVKGAAENAPADLKKFAKAIKQLKKIPGASQYTKKLVEVAEIISPSKGAKGAKGGAAGAAPAAGAVGDGDEDDSVAE